jgi:ribosomal protein L12E/L44/L45/RPP1/RPP2
MQANLIEAAKAKTVDTESAAERKTMNEQAGPSKNANVRKENRRLQARIRELEQKKVPETSAAAPATMTVANACPHCNTSHPWTPETCKRNPAYKAEWEKKRKEYATQRGEASKKPKRTATNDPKITEIKE